MQTLGSNVDDKDADVYNNMLPTDRSRVIEQTLNLEDKEETAMMVFPSPCTKSVVWTQQRRRQWKQQQQRRKAQQGLSCRQHLQINVAMGGHCPAR